MHLYYFLSFFVDRYGGREDNRLRVRPKDKDILL